MSVLLKYSLVYIIGGTFGYLTELLFRRIVHKKWINPGFLVGPNLPLYGLGLCLLFTLSSADYSFISSPLWRNVFIIVAIALSMTAIEYITGILFIKGMHVKLWDYSDRKGNIQGIICPLFSLAWALVGAFYHFVLHSRVQAAALGIAAHPVYGYFLGLYFGVMLVDVCYSFRVTDKIRKWAKERRLVVKYEELKATIKTKTTALKEKYSFLLPLKSNRDLKHDLDDYEKHDRLS